MHADPDGQRVAESPGAADRGGLTVTGQGQAEQLAQRDQRPESQRVPGLHQAGRGGLRHGRDQKQPGRADEQQLAGVDGLPGGLAGDMPLRGHRGRASAALDDPQRRGGIVVILGRDLGGEVGRQGRGR